jgi:hypothetical protein
MEQETIKKIVSDHFNISIEDMESKTRIREVVIARQAAMVLMYDYIGLSQKAIGEQFGMRDHSTVNHAQNTIEDLKYTQRSFKRSWEALISKIELEETKLEREVRRARKILKDENRLKLNPIKIGYSWETRKTA